uniref:Uncharacterized protein n=1 Tax=Percolomonas cosmopolitus TaxID=63605 RepID=A0A7S1KPK2_9EUKA
MNQPVDPSQQNPQHDTISDHSSALETNDAESLSTMDNTNHLHSIINHKNEQISFLQHELRKNSHIMNDIQDKLHQTQMLLEATEVANREGSENQIISDLEEKIRAISQQNLDLKQEVNNLKDQNEEYEIQTKKMLRDVHEKDHSIQSLQERNTHIDEVQRTRDEQVRELRATLEMKNEEMERYREKLSQLEMEKLELRERAMLRLNLFSNGASSEEEQQRRDALSTTAESLGDSQHESRADIFQSSAANVPTVQSLKSQLESLQSKYNTLHSDYNTLANDSTLLKKEREHMQSQVVQLQNNIEEHLQMISLLNNKLQQDEELIKSQQDEIASLSTKAEKLMKYSQQNNFVEQIFREDQDSSTSEQSSNRQRLITTLNAKLIHQINIEYSLRESIAKVKNRAQHYHDQYLFLSRQHNHLQTNEENLHAKIEHLTQSLLSLEREKSKLKSSNEDYQLMHHQLSTSIRKLNQQLREKEDDCSILSRQLNTNVEEFYQKYRQELSASATALGGKSSGLRSLKNSKKDEELCSQLEKMITSRGKVTAARKDGPLLEVLQSAVQTIRKHLKLNMQNNDIVQNVQRDSKHVLTVCSRTFKLLHEIEIERDSVIQKLEALRGHNAEMVCSNEHDVLLQSYQQQLNVLLNQLSESNEQISSLTADNSLLKTQNKSLQEQLSKINDEFLKQNAEHQKSLQDEMDKLTKEASRLDESVRRYYEDNVLAFLRDSSSVSSTTDNLLSELFAQKQVEKTLVVEQTRLLTRIQELEDTTIEQAKRIETLRYDLSVAHKNLESASSNPLMDSRAQQLELLQKRYDDLLKTLKSANVPVESRTSQQDGLRGSTTLNAENISHLRNLNERLQKDNETLKQQLQEAREKIEQLDEQRTEEDTDNEQRLAHIENQSNVLISKLATQNLRIDELENTIQEKDAEIEQFHVILTRKLANKKRKNAPSKVDPAAHLKALIKSHGILHAKLRASLQNEVDLREKLEQRHSQIEELRKALQSIQKNGPSNTLNTSGSGLRKRKSSGGGLKAGTMIRISESLLERESEINCLRKDLTNLQIQLAKQSENLDNERSAHATNVSDLEKEVDSLTEKLQAAIQQKNSLEGRLVEESEQTKSTESSRNTEREQLISKLQEITKEHEDLHEEYTKHNQEFVELKVQIGKRESEINEKNNQIQQLNDHLQHVVQNLDQYKSALKSKEYEIEKSQVISDGNLDKTLSHLQQEQLNVQKLMDLVQKLRAENDLLMREKVNGQKLRDQLQILQPKFDQLLEEKQDIEQQFHAAKDYILQLREERDSIKQKMKQEKERLTTELKNQQMLQKHQESSFEKRIEELEERVKAERDVFRTKERSLQTDFQEYISKLQQQIDEEKDAMMKDKVHFQKSEHRMQKSISEIEEALSAERTKRIEAESKLIQEKETNMEHITQIDHDFRNYKEAQERIVEVYEKEIKELTENLKQIDTLRSQVDHLTEKLGEKDAQISEVTLAHEDCESKLTEQKNKAKSLNKQISKLQKQFAQEKEVLTNKIEEAKKHSYNSDEWVSMNEDLKNVRKQFKQLTDDYNKKTKLMTALKEERDEQQEQILKYENENQQCEEKVRKIHKDLSRKDALVREYKTRMDEIKQENKVREDQNNSLKSKVREVTGAEARKDKLIKDLHNVIEQKNKFASQLKDQLKHSEEEVEKKDTKLKNLKTKLDRLHQTEELKQKDFTTQIETVRALILSIAEDQCKSIERLEYRLNTSIASTQQINSILKKQLRSPSIESILTSSSSSSGEQRDASLTSMPDTSSISMHMLNLSPEELQDIMTSTKRLEASVNSHQQQQEAILQRNDKTLVAQALLQSVRTHLHNNQIAKAKKELEKLLRMRLDLERSLAIANKEQFFNQKQGEAEEKENRASEGNPTTNGVSNNEAQKLKNELEKMKQRESIYEGTIQSLESHLNQLIEEGT